MAAGLLGALALLSAVSSLAGQEPFLPLFDGRDLPESGQAAVRLINRDRLEEALPLLEQADADLSALPEDRRGLLPAKVAILKILCYQALEDDANVEAEYRRLKARYPEFAEAIGRLLWPKLELTQGSPRYVDPPKGPYRGKVIDAETKRPIQGAVVLAYWEYERPVLVHLTTRFYDAREVLTDENGEFFMDVADIEGRAPPRTRAPRFIIFKPGYGHYPDYQLTPKTDLIAAFRGKGSVVELIRWKTKKAWSDASLSPPLHVPEDKMPKLLKALDDNRRQ